MSHLVLGIDGGGSKTIARLARYADQAEPVLLGMGKSEGTNLSSESAETVIARLNHACREAWQTAGLAPMRLSGAAICLAGAGRTEQRRTIYRWAETARLAEHTLVAPDVCAALAAAVPTGPGLVLVAGTGSIAYGRRPDGLPVRAGGWGPLLGDDGSGYWIGQAAVREALKRCEQSIPATAATDRLTQRVLESFQCTTGAELLDRCYALSAPQAEISRLAPMVIGLMDDVAAAATIVQQAVVHWIELLARAARALQGDRWSREVEIAWGMAGGVATADPRLAAWVTEGCRERGICLGSPRIVDDPSWGAVQLAHQCATEFPLSADLLRFQQDHIDRAANGHQNR